MRIIVYIIKIFDIKIRNIYQYNMILYELVQAYNYINLFMCNMYNMQSYIIL